MSRVIVQKFEKPIPVSLKNETKVRARKLAKVERDIHPEQNQQDLGEGLSFDKDNVFDSEAKQVENALQRSFGRVTVETKRRSKASDGLAAVAAHWTDGDAKKLVLALAHRYGARLKFSNADLKKPLALLVSSSKNSVCNSAKLKDLDWDRGWWTDDSFGMHYLHVHHKDGETVHRVYCKHCQQPRIEQRHGKLYWLFCR